MDQRLSIITLGVSDLARATDFYERLGWRWSRGASNASIGFFQAGGVVLALYDWGDLARDAGVPLEDKTPYRGVTLAHNVAERDDVERVLAEVEAAGGRIVKPAGEAFWGGYHGYFTDPDGHLWEVAWNPHLRLGADGTLRLPD